MASPIVGPIAPYSNPPINPQYYQPSRFFISAISLGSTTTVTTTEDNNYVIGQLCRLIIPPGNVSRQLNEAQGYVLSLPADDQVELDIYSSGVDTFVTTATGTQPQILAIGDINQGQINTTPSTVTTYPAGAFINISPN